MALYIEHPTAKQQLTPPSSGNASPSHVNCGQNICLCHRGETRAMESFGDDHKRRARNNRNIYITVRTNKLTFCHPLNCGETNSKKVGRLSIDRAGKISALSPCLYKNTTACGEDQRRSCACSSSCGHSRRSLLSCATQEFSKGFQLSKRCSVAHFRAH